MSIHLTPVSVSADYFDGQSARPRSVQLRIEAGQLLITGDGLALQVPVKQVQWPERTRHGARVAHLRGGGSLKAHDTPHWDAWVRGSALGESIVVKAQQNWRATLAAVMALVVLAAVGYMWGVPLLARATLAFTPTKVDRAIGEVAMQSIEEHLLLPSQVPVARQQAIRESFALAMARTYPESNRPAYELRFHASPKADPANKAEDAPTRVGPNAFALPGGVIVVTDDMVALLQGRDDVMLGVLGHEYGHVRRRHGMRLLVQATVIGTVASVVWGDFNSLMALAPVVLGQSAYSRDFEREADTDAVRLLRANQLPPEVMAELFERLTVYRKKVHGDDGHGSGLGIALASHPPDTERIKRFRDAGR